MEAINKDEMTSIFGGQEEPAICRELQGEASAHANDPEFDWDAWADLFYEFCV